MNPHPVCSFKPGYDPRRNRRGSTRGQPYIGDLLKRIGRDEIPPELVGKLPETIRASKCMLEALMRIVFVKAMQGEGWAVQFIAERTEGKIKDRVAVENGGTLHIVEEIVDAAPPAPDPG